MAQSPVIPPIHSLDSLARPSIRRIATLLVAGFACASPLHAQTMRASIVEQAHAALKLKFLVDSLGIGVARNRVSCNSTGSHNATLESILRDDISAADLRNPPTMEEIAGITDALIRECPTISIQQFRAPLGNRRFGVSLRRAPAAAPLMLANPVAGVGAPLLGLANQAALVQGVATFLTDRARDELVLTFLEQLPRLTAAGKSRLPDLMPVSWALVTKVGYTNFGSLLPMLKASMQRDLETLPEHLPKLVPEASTPNVAAAVNALSVANRITKRLRAGATPIAALADLNDLRLDSTDRALGVALQRMSTIASEYRSHSDAMQELLRSAAGRRFFILYFVENEIAKGRLPVPAMDNDAIDFIRERGADVLSFAQQMQDLQTTVNALRKDSAGRANPAQAFSTVLSQTVDLFGRAPSLADANTELQVDSLLAYAHTAVDIHTAFAGRNYQAGLISAFELIRGLGVSLTPRNQQFMMLAATLASTQKPEEVTQALRTAALPVGSYRAKRAPALDARTTSLTLNAYVGLGFGKEGVRTAGTNRYDGYISPVAAVGPEISWAHTWGGKGKGEARENGHASSLGIFVPLIDVGTVASARLSNDDEVDNAAEAGLSQVFAPGIFGVIGIGQTLPITFGLGLQQVPKLRQTAEGLRTARRSFAFFAAIDIPLFSF